jgi:hypothetical protein
MAKAKKSVAILHSPEDLTAILLPIQWKSGAILLLAKLHHFSAEWRAKWQ